MDKNQDLRWVHKGLHFFRYGLRAAARLYLPRSLLAHPAMCKLDQAHHRGIRSLGAAKGHGWLPSSTPPKLRCDTFPNRVAVPRLFFRVVLFTCCNDRSCT